MSLGAPINKLEMLSLNGFLVLYSLIMQLIVQLFVYCVSLCTLCPEKIDQHVFCNIFHKTWVILMKFGA